MTIFDHIRDSNAFRILILKWDAISLCLVAGGLGVFLIQNPQVLDYAEAYEILSKIFTSQVFGIIFISLASMKLLSVIFDWLWLRILSISLLVGIWVLFGSALFQTDALNSVWIHSFGWALISFGVAIREWIK